MKYVLFTAQGVSRLSGGTRNYDAVPAVPVLMTEWLPFHEPQSIWVTDQIQIANMLLGMAYMSHSSQELENRVRRHFVLGVPPVFHMPELHMFDFLGGLSGLDREWLDKIYVSPFAALQKISRTLGAEYYSGLVSRRSEVMVGVWHHAVAVADARDLTPSRTDTFRFSHTFRDARALPVSPVIGPDEYFPVFEMLEVSGIG